MPQPSPQQLQRAQRKRERLWRQMIAEVKKRTTGAYGEFMAAVAAAETKHRGGDKDVNER